MSMGNAPSSPAAAWGKGGYQAVRMPVKLWGRGDCVAASEDGHTLVCCGSGDTDDGTAELQVSVYTSTGSLRCRLGEIEEHRHARGVRCVAIDGDAVASGSEDDTIRLWSLSSGECTGVLTGHTLEVWALAMRGDLVVSGSRDQTVRWWSRQTKQCSRVGQGHASTINGLALGDGIAISASTDGSARVWLSAERPGVPCRAVLEHPPVCGLDGTSQANAVYSVSMVHTCICTDAYIRAYYIRQTSYNTTCVNDTSRGNAVYSIGIVR